MENSYQLEQGWSQEHKLSSPERSSPTLPVHRYSAQMLSSTDALSVTSSTRFRRRISTRWIEGYSLWQAEGNLGPFRYYFERCRGSSKTTDLALQAIWLLAFAPRRIEGIAAAADFDQAKLLQKAIQRILDENPWLQQLLFLKQRVVANEQTGSSLEFISADVGSSYGHLVDFVLVDELSHWPESGEGLWHSLLSTAAKRRHCMLAIISNAGTNAGSGWQWRVMNAAREGNGWYFHSWPRPAQWISEELLEEQQRMLPGVTYQRLWCNVWSSGEGDCLLPEDIDAALKRDVQKGFQRDPDWEYAAGLDLGLKKDAASLCVVARHWEDGRYRLIDSQSWKPTDRHQVSIEEVEQAVLASHRDFDFSQLYLDPWQGAYLAERLQQVDVPVETFDLTVSHWDEMARHLVSVFQERVIDLYHCPDLLRDLRRTMVIEKNNGKLRLDWQRDSHGHGDSAMAFCLALIAARDFIPHRQPFIDARSVHEEAEQQIASGTDIVSEVNAELRRMGIRI